MLQENQIKSLVEQVVQEALPEAFIVELHLPGDGNKNLTLLLDTDRGITIDDCARVSRKLGFILEERNVFETPYLLEVSSPGLSRPLRVKRQYVKNVGRKLKVLTSEGQALSGVLLAAGEDGITLGPSPKAKNKKNREVNGGAVVEAETFIPFENIKEAKVKISMNN